MSKKIIYIDPGHGGLDAGATNNKRYEKNDNLKMSFAVRDKLLAQGYTVLLTRETDSANPSLEARIGAANAAGADFFLSLHRNSFTSSTAKGIEIWARYNNHVAAATTVLEAVAEIPHQANRGVKIGAYRVLYNAKMPAMLLELGFISNAKDNELFDTHFDKYATAIAQGILTALGEAWSESGKEAAIENKPLYRVQVGAFGVKTNAEAFLKTVKEMGLSAFIVMTEATKEEGH